MDPLVLLVQLVLQGPPGLQVLSEPLVLLELQDQREIRVLRVLKDHQVLLVEMELQ